MPERGGVGVPAPLCRRRVSAGEPGVPRVAVSPERIYVSRMNREQLHPPSEQIELSKVLDCLSDPTRLAIVARLADADGPDELRCGDFSALGSKSNLSYHFMKLRDAGIAHSRFAGTNRLIRLRWDDLESRFPGLLDVILRSSRKSGAP